MHIGTLPKRGNYLNLLNKVELRPTDTPKRGSINVQTVWRDVERAECKPFCIKSYHRDLAKRLKILIEEGYAYGEAVILRNAASKTYVSVTRRFCNATLRRDIEAMEKEMEDENLGKTIVNG